jgi:antitoxin (DNA-binding transcriptional repressor) of toxin-antitoxin stability system
MFHVHPDHGESSPEELATEVIDRAKAGHHVLLTLTSGATVEVFPHEDHHTVAQKIAEASAGKDAGSRGRKAKESNDA